MKKSIFPLLLFVTIPTATFSQDSTLFYSAKIQGAISNGTTPFWQQANQNGVVPVKGSYLLAETGVHRVYNPNNPRIFQWAAGAEIIAVIGKKSSGFFTDLFIAGKAGPFELSLGQRKEVTGLADSSLSSGSIAMSGNTRPFPRIQISTTKFVDILPGNDLISFKFSYSDGLLGSSIIQYGNVNRIESAYLHQKQIYIKLGSKDHKLNLFAGFNHQVIWGGEDQIFTGGLKRATAYKYVVFGKAWRFSRVGNHFGTIDVGGTWKGRRWEAFAYRQSIYEDGSLSNLSNIADGLNGLRFRRINRTYNEPTIRINTILFEFVYTKNQGGSVFDFTTGTFGRDNYFNHYVYKQGWSYRNRTLGTPLIAPQYSLREYLINSSASYTSNNRIVAYHLGADVSWKEIIFHFKGTYSVNSGTYNTGYAPSIGQTSILAWFETPLLPERLGNLHISLATDIGRLYPNSSSILIGWKKSGFIR